MRFFCDRCKTRYTIDDAKVRGKVLKIRCKNCGNVMTVSDSGGSSTGRSLDTASAAARARSHRPGGSLVGGRAKGEGSSPGASSRGRRQPKGGAAARITFRTSKTGAARDTLKEQPAMPGSAGPSAGAAFGGSLEEQTMISQPGFDMSSIQKEAREAMGRGRSGGKPRPADELEEWYLADDIGQWGPMTFSELAARVKRGEPGPNPQAWRDGMTEWQDLHDIPELRPYIKHLPPPRASGAKGSSDEASQDMPEGGPTIQDPQPAQRSKRGAGAGVGAGAGAPTASGAGNALGAATAGAKAGEEESSIGKGGVGLESSFFGKDGLGEAGGGEASSSQGADSDGQAGIAAPAGLSAPALGVKEAEPAAADLLGGEAGLTGAGLTGGAPAPVTPLRPPKDNTKNFVIIFAIIGGIVALAMVVLVIYVIMRDQDSSAKEAAKKGPEVAARTGDAMEAGGESASGMAAGDEMKAAREAGSRDSGDEGEGEELVMGEVEIALSGKSSSSGRRSRGRQESRTRSRSRARSTSRSRSSLGSGFGSPNIYGSVGGGGASHRRNSPTVDTSESRRSRSSSRRARRPVTKPEVMSVVRRNVHRLKRCYERAVRLHPAQLRRVSLKVKFRVNSRGKVTSVGITPGKYRGFSLGSCIISSVRRWKFPPSTKSYGTVFPVNFVGR